MGSAIRECLSRFSPAFVGEVLSGSGSGGGSGAGASEDEAASAAGSGFGFDLNKPGTAAWTATERVERV